MGLNLDLCQMLNAPRTVACPKCGENTPSDFDDYDVECGKPNPAPGVWNLHCYCSECDFEWNYSMPFRPDLEDELFRQIDAKLTACKEAEDWKARAQAVEKVFADLRTISRLVHSQDNRMTQHPMFCVQEKVTIYGMDPEYSEEVVWIDTSNDSDEVPEPEGGEEKDGIIRTGKMAHWKTVMVAFTEEGCKEYLRLNGHNHHGETRIYVESFNRCPEMIAIRECLLTLTPPGGSAAKCD